MRRNQKFVCVTTARLVENIGCDCYRNMALLSAVLQLESYKLRNIFMRMERVCRICGDEYWQVQSVTEDPFFMLKAGSILDSGMCDDNDRYYVNALLVSRDVRDDKIDIVFCFEEETVAEGSVLAENWSTGSNVFESN